MKPRNQSINKILLSLLFYFLSAYTASSAGQYLPELHQEDDTDIPGIRFGMTRLEFLKILELNKIRNPTWETNKTLQLRYSPQDLEIACFFDWAALSNDQKARFSYGFKDDILIYRSVNIINESKGNDPKAQNMCKDDFSKLRDEAIKNYGSPKDERIKTKKSLELINKEDMCQVATCRPDEGYSKTTSHKYESNNYHLHLEKKYISNKWNVEGEDGNDVLFKRSSCNIYHVLNYDHPQLTNSDFGVRNSKNQIPIPVDFIDGITPYTTPATMIDTKMIEKCDHVDKDRFTDCMVTAIITEEPQQRAYACMRSYQKTNNKDDFGVCLLKSGMGTNERKVVNDAYECNKENGKNLDKILVCLASKSNDKQTARVAGCIQQQSKSTDFSYWQLAACYGAKELNMNAETSIAVECAMSSGGEPITFIGCTSGRLTAMELEKCFSKGIGGDGCFGKGNTIIKHYKSIGDQLNQTLGESNDIARTWNNAVTDISEGPGPNNDLAKAAKSLRDAANNLSNDATNGVGKNNDLVQAINKAIPGFEKLF